MEDVPTLAPEQSRKAAQGMFPAEPEVAAQAPVIAPEPVPVPTSRLISAVDDEFEDAPTLAPEPVRKAVERMLPAEPEVAAQAPVVAPEPAQTDGRSAIDRQRVPESVSPTLDEFFGEDDPTLPPVAIQQAVERMIPPAAELTGEEKTLRPGSNQASAESTIPRVPAAVAPEIPDEEDATVLLGRYLDDADEDSFSESVADMTDVDVSIETLDREETVRPDEFDDDGEDRTVMLPDKKSAVRSTPTPQADELGDTFAGQASDLFTPATPTPARKRSAEQPSDVRPRATMYDKDRVTGRDRFVITEDITTIGRAAIAEGEDPGVMVIHRGTVGRQHATIEFTGGFFWLTDQRSVNGSFLNGRRIVAAERLRDGDTLRFDVHEFVLEIEQPTSERELLSAAEQNDSSSLTLPIAEGGAGNAPDDDDDDRTRRIPSRSKNQ